MIISLQMECKLPKIVPSLPIPKIPTLKSLSCLPTKNSQSQFPSITCFLAFEICRNDDIIKVKASSDVEGTVLRVSISFFNEIIDIPFFSASPVSI